MKKAMMFAAAALSALLAFGCSSQKEEPQQKKKLMVYTSMKEVLIGKVRDQFTAVHPDVEFDYYSAGAGKLMAKIAAERQSGRIACDV